MTFSSYLVVLAPGHYAKMRNSSGGSGPTACPLKVSVCTGALLLGAAGFLKGRTATTHPSAFKELREYCEAVVDQRIVDAGDVVAGGGVTAAIDVGLYLVERLAGHEAKQKISRQMDYPHNPAADRVLKTG